MEDISIHIEKTEKIILRHKDKLVKELANCTNELRAYEIRSDLLRTVRKEEEFKDIKLRLKNKYNIKASSELKNLYKLFKNI